MRVRVQTTVSTIVPYCCARQDLLCSSRHFCKARHGASSSCFNQTMLSGPSLVKCIKLCCHALSSCFIHDNNAAWALSLGHVVLHRLASLACLNHVTCTAPLSPVISLLSLDHTLLAPRHVFLSSTSTRHVTPVYTPVTLSQCPQHGP